MTECFSQLDRSNHIMRKYEDGSVLEGAREQPSLSILPRPEIERCGPRTRGVMVKRSDAERKGREKNRKWPWEDCKRSREM